LQERAVAGAAGGRAQWRDAHRSHEAMNSAKALLLANEMLKTFIESQEIPPGGSSGTAISHGEKTAQFLTAMHRELLEYFGKVDD
jgi:hypothetical protein